MSDPRTLYLRLITRHAAAILSQAGLEAEARKLGGTQVRVHARLACIFRVLRVIEQSTQVRWGLARLGPTLPGRAAEALSLVRCAAITALADPGPMPWLEALEARARVIAREVGAAPGGTIEAEIEAMEEEDLEREDGEAGHPGGGEGPAAVQRPRQHRRVADDA